MVRAASFAVPMLLAGCSGDTLEDESTGFVDLGQGVTRSLAPTRGWTNGTRVEYQDFGSVTVPRKLGTRGEQLRVPDNAPVQPMYFFFDSQGRPLFSKPAFDTRSKLWSMPGGTGARLPSPIAEPTAEPGRSAYFSNTWQLKPRDLYVDGERGSADYQRPVVDALDSGGLWEVVEVTVKDSDYSPDFVKSLSTIKSGVDDGKLKLNETGKVINCPMVDDRTVITPSAMYNNIPRPRIEVWFKTKLGSCYLINGWETIGEAVDEAMPTTDPSNLRLFHAGVDQDKRVDTFDVVRVTVGVGANEQTAVTVPIAKYYTPTVAITTGAAVPERITRYNSDSLTTALPRHKQSDPGGYSPIVWLWDLTVPQDPPYVFGSYKDIGNADPLTLVARETDSNVFTRNIAIVGAATKCTSDMNCKFGQTCNTMPDLGIATIDAPPGQNIADVVIQREGGPRCDVPATTFGGLCGPGVARCDVQTPAGSDNEKALKALGVAVAGPLFTVHADLKAAQQKLSDNQAIAAGNDPTNMGKVYTDAEKTTAQNAIAGNQKDVDTATARAKYYDDWGFTKDFNGYGYSCFPGNAGLGYCQIRCDSTVSAAATMVKATLKVPNALSPGVVDDVEYTFPTDARCGGANMLGYKCGHATNNGTVNALILPERGRVCLRECQAFVPLNQSNALCSFPFNVKADTTTGNPYTLFSLGGGVPPLPGLTGQTCTNFALSVQNQTTTVSSTVNACNWNPDFEPRSQEVWPVAR
ncbi:MAG: hypothetical protein QM756_40935 [Polyangiaceae bacterium]